MDVGPVELILIIVIVAMLFGVGKLPEIFGAVGKGIREFRQEVAPEPAKTTPVAKKSTPIEPSQATSSAISPEPATASAIIAPTDVEAANVAEEIATNQG